LQSPQPLSLNHKYFINDDDNKDGDSFFHPTSSGPSNGGIGNKLPAKAIPRVLLQSLQPPSLEHKYSINDNCDDNKNGGNVFRPTSSGPSNGGIGHKPPTRASDSSPSEGNSKKYYH